MHYFHTGRRLLGTLLFVVLLGSGCTPRPQFKVKVTSITKYVDSLLVILWLANPPPAGSGELSMGYGNVEQEQPPSGFTQFILPACAASDMACQADEREYTFGLDYTQDPNLTRHVALVGVAAVGEGTAQKLQGKSGCLQNVLTGQITDPASLGQPDTLTISLLTGGVDPSSCLPGSFVVTDVSVQRDISASTNSANSSNRQLIVSGWGFTPDVTLTVSDGCMTATTIDQAQPPDGGAVSSGAAKITVVTPTQITAELGSSIDLLRDTCMDKTMAAQKSVIVNNRQGSTTPFVFN